MAIFESDAEHTESKMESLYEIRTRNLWIAILLLSIATTASISLLISIKLKENIRKRQEEKDRLEKEKRILEDEMVSYRELYKKAEEEMCNLEKIKNVPRLDNEIRKLIDERFNVLNNFITASVAGNRLASAKKAMDDYLKDKERFVYTTRLYFVVLHPNFITYLKESELSETEIGYCCLYCLGLNGAEISSYLDLKSLYNISSAIRKKLGLGNHDSNLNKFLLEKMHSLD